MLDAADTVATTASSSSTYIHTDRHSSRSSTVRGMLAAGGRLASAKIAARAPRTTIGQMAGLGDGQQSGLARVA